MHHLYKKSKHLAFPFLVIYRCHPYGAGLCVWKPISTKMSPLRGCVVRFVKQNKPFKNQQLRNYVSSCMILEWQGGPWKNPLKQGWLRLGSVTRLRLRSARYSSSYIDVTPTGLSVNLETDFY